MSEKIPEFITEGDGFVTVELKRGLTVAGTKVTAVKMREPTVGDQLAADKLGGSQGEREVALIANLCELAPADLRALSLHDYGRLQVAVARFIV